MVKQYPHTLFVSSLAATATDENGNWQQSETTTTEHPCRYEPNDKGLLVETAGGQSLVYSGIVYGKFDGIGTGALVEIKNGDLTIAKGNAKLFSKGQLNSRIWL